MALKDIPVELVVRCQNADRGAQEQLFGLIREDLFRWIYSMVRNEEDALELLQECCLRVFRHLPRLKEPEKFAGWTSRLVVNQVNTWRVKARKTALDELTDGIEVENDQLPIQGGRSTPNPRAALSRKQVLERVNAAMNELPPKQRIAVELFDLQHHSIREIAELQGCSEGAVKFNIFQGRRKLRELLEPYVNQSGLLDMEEVL
ncbi:MAG: RNA polymerase sigma factor [Candidatus Sumerlaeia bacterium]|nr:RNA polymerase sigma factor [Candidatus Sumerlaeia bacterium]